MYERCIFCCFCLLQKKSTIPFFLTALTDIYMLQRMTAQDWIAYRSKSMSSVFDQAEQIMQNVASRGDEALFEYTERFDGVSLDRLRVSDEIVQNALELVNDETIQALTDAYERIFKFHELQKQKNLWLHEMEPGITLGVKTTPLERVGIYVPGGRAAYPSTVFMGAAPARVAGVKEICVCTPTGQYGPSPLTLVACNLCGIKEIHQIGGAQAIAAMAYGTESIQPVDRIVGPGNAYVAAAKQLVQKHVGIDFPAGPSELAIIADETAKPAFIAADIIAQSEHDPHASSVLITPSEKQADLVEKELALQLETVKRHEIVKEALSHAGVIITADLLDAAEISNTIAPEHLSLQVSDPFAILSLVKHAGSIFAGSYAPVACGDYASGTNHILPTSGYARQCSGLNVSHFTKTSTVQIINKEGLMQMHETIERIADAEGLHAHADSVRIRLRS